MLKQFIITAGILAFAGPALAANLVTNGGFETASRPASFEFSTVFGTQNDVAGWTASSGYNLLFDSATATTVSADSRFGNTIEKIHALPSASPTGGNFVALDGDTGINGSISQVISGLTVGKSYNLQFSWAAAQLFSRDGDTTEMLNVTFGNDVFSTAVVSNPSRGFTGWFNESARFTATSSSQVLSFLSIGTPNGAPPLALLDGVSLSAVPEASTWAMLIVGFGIVGFAARRKAALAAS
jgi:hypothetical protein